MDAGPFTKSDGSPAVDFVAYLSGTTPSANPHTLFAPTDAAFDAIGIDVVTALLDQKATNPLLFADLASRWLELHVLPVNYLMDDFLCNANYNTFNPSNLLASQQRQRTRCAGVANQFNQIGGGNVGEIEQPTPGQPANVFAMSDFPNTNTPVPITSDSTGTGFSSNIITCNGVVHVVDIPLRPGRQSSSYYGPKGGKAYGGYAGKASKSYYYGYRTLEEDEFSIEDEEFPIEDEDRNTDRENRRARLESLLVDPNGHIEAL